MLYADIPCRYPLADNQFAFNAFRLRGVYMLKKLLHSRKGDGYVDLCVGVLVFVMMIIISLNIFEFVTLRVEMDQIADQLIESATYEGCFGEMFTNTDMDMLDDYYYYDLDYGADEYYNSAYERVQLGDRMWVKITVDTSIKGIGVNIPITLSVKKSGLSEKYWK